MLQYSGGHMRRGIRLHLGDALQPHVVCHRLLPGESPASESSSNSPSVVRTRWRPRTQASQRLETPSSLRVILRSCSACKLNIVWYFVFDTWNLVFISSTTFVQVQLWRNDIQRLRRARVRRLRNSWCPRRRQVSVDDQGGRWIRYRDQRHHLWRELNEQFQ